MKSTPIVIVHLFAYGLSTYMGKCLSSTSAHNPKSTIYLITAEEEVKRYVDSLGLSNVQCSMHEEEYKTIFSQVDKSFFHDGINSRIFDLQCFVRHTLVSRLIIANKLPDVHTTQRLVFSDSDIMILDEVDKIFSVNDPRHRLHGFSARSPLISYFSIWDALSYVRVWYNFDLLSQYFKQAELNQGRCSDMHYCAWAVRSNHVSYSDNIDKSFLHIDTYRDILFHGQLWRSLQLLPSTKEKLDQFVKGGDNIDDYPSGIWKDKEFILLFSDKEYLAEVFARGQSSKIFNVGDQKLYACRSVYLSSKARFINDIQSNGASELSRLILNYVLGRAGSRVAMIHYQANAKELANKTFDFLFEKDMTD